MEMVDRPNIWTDGSLEEHPVGGFEVAGSGVYFPAPEASLLGSVWGVSGAASYSQRSDVDILSGAHWLPKYLT